ncbi:hypothetical protein [Actinomadura fibrosa]|uniref:AAA+ ATPase domain-containing protein n=1 Tax=Actinomadura fibrosa TaxID=111802 RepID=A0ABW2XSY1_9ACTN|nr:hypothetical protein [Actinomadura fibrosa]
MTNDPPAPQSPDPEEPLDQILADFLRLMDEANDLMLPDDEVERRLRRLKRGDFPDGGESPPAEPNGLDGGDAGDFDGLPDLPPSPQDDADRGEADCLDPRWMSAQEVEAARLAAEGIRAAAVKRAAEVEAEARQRAAAMELEAQEKAEEYKGQGVTMAAERLADARKDAEAILADARERADRLLADARRELEEARREATRITELAEAHARGWMASAGLNPWAVPPPLPHYAPVPPGAGGGHDLLPAPVNARRELMVYRPSLMPAMPPGDDDEIEDAAEVELVDDDEVARHRLDDDADFASGVQAAHPPPPHTVHAEPARPWASSGQVHCAAVAVSAVPPGGRDDDWRGDVQQLHLRRSLYLILQEAFDMAGIGWLRCRSYDRGDSVLVLLPPDLAPDLLANTLIDGTRVGLRRYNRRSSESSRLRLRAALHMGIVNFDAAGATGTSLDHLEQLLKAPEFVSACGDSAGDLALITSDYVYENVIRHYAELMDCHEFRPMRVGGAGGLDAWGYFPTALCGGHSAAALDGAAARKELARLRVGDHEVVIGSDGSTITACEAPPPAVRKRTRPSGRAVPDSVPVLLDAEMRRLANWLDEGVPVLVWGRAGAGKSTLLRRFAGHRAASGGDVVSLSAAGMAIDDIVQTLYRSCYEADRHRPGPDRMRLLMGAVRALIVVDDFGGSAADAERLLNMVPASEVVVASRTRLDWERGRALEVRELTEQAALALLDRRLRGRVRGSDRDASARLCRIAQRNPRAILQTAAALRITGGRSGPADFGAVTRLLTDGLTPDARAVLQVLRTLEGTPVPPGLLARLAGVPDGRSALAWLRRMHLAQPAGPGYVATVQPDTVQSETGQPDTVQPDTGPAAAVAPEPPPRPADYARPLTRWSRPAETRQIGEAAAVIVVVLADAVRQGSHAAALELARAVAPALGATLRWDAWRRVLALGGEAARSAGAARDAAYFDGEDLVRRRALGQVADTDAAAEKTTTSDGAAASGDRAPDEPETVTSRRRTANLATFVLTTLVLLVLAVPLVLRHSTDDRAKRSAAPHNAAQFTTAARPGSGAPVASAGPPSLAMREPAEAPSFAPILIVPATLTAGIPTTVALSGFSPGEQVRFWLEGSDVITLDSVTMSSAGWATAEIRQDAPPGRYVVLARGLTSGLTAQTKVRLM